MRNTFYFILFFGLLPKRNCRIDLVCLSYDDYYSPKDNPNCWTDLAVSANATEIIKSYGYPLEVYKLTAVDGYVLSLFRIPNHDAPVKKSPVYLQHGIYSTAANFVGNRKDSLAFVLSDAGYDVWLGSYRGTEYSEGHVNLTVYDKQFWDFSYDELAMIDIPTILKAIHQKTEQKGNVVYVGHSLGTTLGLAYAATYPEEIKKMVKVLVMMAPAAPIPNIKLPLGLLAAHSTTILNVIRHFDLTRLLSHAEVLKTITSTICLETVKLMQTCLNLFNLFYGPFNQISPSTVPVFINQFPAGTSVKVLKHAGDMALGHFRKYDYGVDNFRKYGSLIPPAYDVSVIDIPVFIMFARNDWTCTKTDSLDLFRRLSNSARRYGAYEVEEKHFNHIDFLFGKNAKTLVYKPLLKFLENLL